MIRATLLLAASALPLAAVVTGPYSQDANTPHLYHFSESSGSITANSGLAGRTAYACDGNPIATSPTAVTTILGATGFSGFGNAADFGGNTDYFIGYDSVGTTGYRADNGTTLSTDAIALSTLGIGGSSPFTLEALVRPAGSTGSREIISTDSSAGTRGFQFRIVTGGATGQQLEFNLIGVSGTQKFAEIPNSGSNAFATGSWFHVAFTYDGTSCRFYWTRLDASASEANLLGSPQALAITGGGTITGPLVFGNENRSVAGEGINGAIDEVRISNVARAATEFIFAPNDSDGDGLDDAWEIANFTTITAQNGAGDPDGDGFDNEAEESAGSNPNNIASTPADLDADGLPDLWEIANFGGISAQNGSGDPDGDFAGNLLEFTSGTDPMNPLSWPDSDADTLNDGWELNYFGNLAKSGAADSDSDGSTDKQEHDANSDPTNAQWSATTAELAHRWSFNGTLADSAGTANALIVDPDSNASAGGTAVLSATDVLLSGGAYGTSAFVQLGNGLIGGKRTPVTLELWATPVSIQNWSRVFDVGAGSTEFIMMSWTQGTNAASDRVEWLDSSTSIVNNSVQPYSTGTKYHIVMTLEPNAGAGGTTRVTWYAAAASAPVLGAAKGTFDTANSLPALTDSVFYLGRSQFSADSTANASYDEFRIWNGVLSSTERENYQSFGPDILSPQDDDQDGLADSWELFYFGNLAQSGGDDPDGDGFTNASEFNARSNPIVTASTPTDVDADGLLDTWEMKYFGNLSQTPTADPDGDGENNLTEQANGSAPGNRASNSADVDADSLPDSWENSLFSTLSYNGGSDPDGDGFGNLQEYQAGTNPTVAASRPPGTAVRLVPLDDGDASTSEFGYAGSSAINSVAFVRSSVKTVGNQQFITWYGRHQFDATAAYNNTIWIGRRTLGESTWTVFRHPTFTANTITDGHDVICYGIDGDGYMHLSWGMHGDAFHYSKSVLPVTGNGLISLGPDTTMTGMENTVTYPQFLKLPSGDLLFIFREGASGNGDTYINRYSIATRTWSNVHANGGAQTPFIKGTGWSPNYNAYLNMPQLGGPTGNDLILTWCWRTSSGLSDAGTGFSGYQTNNNLNFARSLDAGLTWKRFDGTPYSLPITRDLEVGSANRAEIITTIPEGTSLINQASTCLDTNDNPVTCTWWAPETPSGNYRRQYRVVFRDDNGTAVTSDDTWQARNVSERTTDPTGTRYAEDHVRDLGRPVIVSDDEDRLIVAYRDNQSASSLTTGLTNGLTIVHSLPKAQDPHRLLWVKFDLTTENLGNYEPIIDNELWDRERQLHFLYQQAEGQGYTAPANLASRFSVLEWNAAAYFAHNPQPTLAFSTDKTQVTISCPSQPSWSYRLWSSTNLQDWTEIETRPGTGQPLDFVESANSGELKRFWRIEYKEGGF